MPSSRMCLSGCLRKAPGPSPFVGFQRAGVLRGPGLPLLEQEMHYVRLDIVRYAAYGGVEVGRLHPPESAPDLHTGRAGSPIVHGAAVRFAREPSGNLEALRGTSGGVTMTTPGGPGTPWEHGKLPPCSAHRLLSYGRSSSLHRAPTLRLPRSYAAGCFLCTYQRACARGVHKKRIIPDDMSIPSPASLALSGRGYAAFQPAELRLRASVNRESFRM